MPEQSIEVECSHCHEAAHYKLGHDSDIDEALTHLKGKTQIQIKSIIKNHKLDKAEYGYALYACPKCLSLYNPYDVRVEYDEIMLFQPFYKCQQCNITLTKAKQPYTDYICKECGQN
ncbi:MAG: hypothetical protein KZQ83_05040 [gamma proteobacterium symbiont of Taylorina sp.]|nr:hypothetical protein [gamma proteobacterium symbiont of Taylorina sp.]